MRFSNFFLYTSKEIPQGAECKSHILSIRANLLYMVSSGIYTYLPLGYRVLKKIENIVRNNMNSIGAQEILMSALQPMQIWEKTGRDKDLNEIMFKFEDRRKHRLCLAPTHEELITEIVKRHVNSYRQLPIILYQIQTKFRDEIRPRFGLVRCCEFVMKDAYSFDYNDRGLDENYEKMFYAYIKIFKECGLEPIAIEADTGFIGGSFSHEFLSPAEIGEDVLYYCNNCNKYAKEMSKCTVCGKEVHPIKMVEIGHIFKLGTKYSSLQEAYFIDEEGKRQPFIMGCYGIGVSRLIPVIIERYSDNKGIIWPEKVAPFKATLISTDMSDNEIVNFTREIYEMLESNNIEILWDDRKESFGTKINDAYLIGNPYIIIVGKRYIKENSVEIENRADSKKNVVRKENIISALKSNI